MDTAEKKQFVVEGYRQFKNRDIEALLQRFTDDAEWAAAKVPGVAFSADVHKGKEALGRYFLDMGKAQEALLLEPRKMVAEDDDVVVIGQSRWKVQATGKQYATDWVQIFTFQGDKVVRVQMFHDTAAVQAAYAP